MTRFQVVVGLFACVLLSTALWADAIQLDNGDTLHGKVVSVTETQVVLQSEVHGKLVLQRKRVVGIVLGDAKGRPAERQPGKGQPGKAGPAAKEGESVKGIVDRLVPKDFGVKQLRELEKGKQPAANPEDVVEQLRNEGLDPALVNELKLRLPGFSSPPVQKYFNDTVQGLISGKVKLGDIRKDAVNARDQLNDLKKDLGPDGAVLDGYLSILNGFINETKPPKPGKPRVVKPQPPKVAPSPK